MARQMNDIKLDNNEDLAIVANDFAIVESTPQHQMELVLTGKGDWKQNPLIGVGADGYIDDEGAHNIVRAITQEFMNDGMEVIDLSPNPVSVADNTVKIFEQAYYR